MKRISTSQPRMISMGMEIERSRHLAMLRAMTPQERQEYRRARIRAYNAMRYQSAAWKAYMAAYRRAHRTTIIEKKRAWYAANAERINAARRTMAREKRRN